ncbi:MAG: glutamine synthetase family protein [Oscillospiraceae bacterium]|nr:glutamine synthetase family protein [Oscillospiraceae bacterium]
MDYTMKEVLQFVEENDVKFIRLAFCDIFGRLKNISILAQELPRAFEQGISFDASAIRGFMNVEASDLFLFPDPGTLVVLPWRPQQGRVARFFCDIRHPDGTPFAGDNRNFLRETVRLGEEMGLQCRVGPECEFYLFELDEKGEPTLRPQDQAGYFDVAPLDKGENVRRDICLTLEQMGLHPETSHHEQGPGQNEIDIRYSDALSAADNLVTFQSVVKAVAVNNGLYASFLPKPLPEKSGSGLHVNLSLVRNGVNLFRGGAGEYDPEAEAFIAGVLRHIREITLFLNPLTNSYRRLGSFEAPRYVTWSRQNRSQLVRIPAAKGELSRMELRSPDPACSQYLGFALIIRAGLDGVRNKLTLPASTDIDLYTASDAVLGALEKLPKDLGEAIEAAAESEFVRSVMDEKTLERILTDKSGEWNRCFAAADQQKFEFEEYFRCI